MKVFYVIKQIRTICNTIPCHYHLDTPTDATRETSKAASKANPTRTEEKTDTENKEDGRQYF